MGGGFPVTRYSQGFKSKSKAPTKVNLTLENQPTKQTRPNETNDRLVSPVPCA